MYRLFFRGFFAQNKSTPIHSNFMSMDYLKRIKSKFQYYNNNFPVLIDTAELFIPNSILYK